VVAAASAAARPRSAPAGTAAACTRAPIAATGSPFAPNGRADLSSRSAWRGGGAGGGGAAAVGTDGVATVGGGRAASAVGASGARGCGAGGGGSWTTDAWCSRTTRRDTSSRARRRR